MELTRECSEKIKEAARAADTGTLAITIQARPEDSRYFDIKLAYEIRHRIRREGAGIKAAQPGQRVLSGAPGREGV
jgi:hypothetical protein